MGARFFATILLMLAGNLAARAADTYSAGQLNIPLLQIGSALLSDIVVTVGSIVTGPTDTLPYFSVDSYNPASNQLTVPVVRVGGATYYNVVVPVASVLSMTGSVSGADLYSGGQLTIPAVQVGANVYTAVITVGTIVHVAGGMPNAYEDTYNPANRELSIPLVSANGRIYTNVTITVGSIISASVATGDVDTGVAAGQGHSCALSHLGTVWCWGADIYGQLGNGGTTRSNTPVPVVGLPSGAPFAVTAIVAGQYHSCALTRLGAVMCWGYDANGELGDGRVETQSSSPVPVVGLSSGVVALSAGGYDTCVITNAGVDLCWGAASGATTPTRPNGLSGYILGIAAGSYHFCALTSAGGNLCWGSTIDGELGNPNANSTITPYPVLNPAGTGNLPAMYEISAGYDITCARDLDANVYCWGAGPLGDGVTVQSGLPVQVLASAGVPLHGVEIATGNQDACALAGLGPSASMVCWGENTWGQLGIGSNSEAYFATTVMGISGGVIGFSMGEDHTCAASLPGSVWCWGLAGSVGNVSGNGSEVPSQVVGVGGAGFLQL
jgi:hypothetical protein